MVTKRINTANKVSEIIQLETIPSESNPAATENRDNKTEEEV
jgi:hypothetical protein